MYYSEWNKVISAFFFNESKADKEVQLFLTKQDITFIGKETGLFEDENVIFDDFINAIIYSSYDENNKPYSITPEDKSSELKLQSCPIGYPLELFSAWSTKDKTKEQFPPYIGYLITYILPLTESENTDYNSNNYYGRVNDFFKAHGILNMFSIKKIGSLNFRYLDVLWHDLEDWSIMIKNCELGFFELHQFQNKKWVHVGNPFSQCVFPPSAIRKLPELFLEAGWIPNSFYPVAELKRILIHYGPSMLSLRSNVIELIRKSESDELGQSILEIVKREYNKWSGESHEIIEGGREERTKRNYVPSRLHLQFKLNTNDGIISFSYRLFSSNDYPEDLKFGTITDLYESKGWSRTIRLNFDESFELKDESNKWIAKFPSRDIRLFISASNFQLSSDYWLETDIIKRSDWMYLLCKNEKKESIIDWGRKYCKEFFDESDLENLPECYSLFKFLNPQESHPDIPILTISSVKTIQPVNGLKLSASTFLMDKLPDIEIVNSLGDEKVFIQYKNTEEEIFLRKKPMSNDIWLLPDDILLNVGFNIFIKNESLQGYKITYTVKESNHSFLSNETFLKQNKFSHNTDDIDSFFQGNKIITTAQINNAADMQLFNNARLNELILQFQDSCSDNLLLKWLVAVKECNLQMFNEAFEVVSSTQKFNNTMQIQDIRRYTVNLLDYLGYIDYDYQRNKIITMPVKLINVPTSIGRKALLIGGRDERLVNQIIEYCSEKTNIISASLEQQDETNRHLLLPCSMVFESNNNDEFKLLANNFSIEYDEFHLLKLKTLIPTITEYEQYIIANNESESQEDYEWARKVFDYKTLKFVTVDALSKDYTLVEYALTSYKKEYGLWISGKYYKVDKSWGRYLIVNHYSEKVPRFTRGTEFAKPGLIFVNKDTLAVPVSIPLPKPISRSFLLLTGIAPTFKEINLSPGTRYYNVYQNIPPTFIDNLFRFKLNMQIESTNNPF
jgi:hypothetical protein